MDIVAGHSFYTFAILGLTADTMSSQGHNATISSLRVGIGLFIFGAASVLQSFCHVELARLRDGVSSQIYQIPASWPFTVLRTPHYFAEILIYVALLFVSHGTATFARLTLMFVIANLCNSARETELWYVERFGCQAVPKPAYIILPGIM